MAIFKSMKVQSPMRLHAPVTYITKPPNAFNEAPPTEAHVNDITTAYELAKGSSTAATAKTAAPDPTLFYHVPLKKVATLPVAKNSLRRYYLYHMAALRIGTAVVKTESTIKVVYMTAAQAAHYLADYVIGEIPWASLPADTKARINAMLNQSVA